MHVVGATGGAEGIQRRHSGVLEAYSKHRRYNSGIVRSLMQDTDTRGAAQRIANCGLRLKLDVFEDDAQGPEHRLTAARVCNHRLCPFCEWRRARVWRKRLFDGLEALQLDHPTRKPLFLTLTCRDPRLEGLRAQVQEMNEAWHRLTKRCGFPSNFWFRRLEITITALPGGGYKAHPHFHVLLLVRSSYFSTGYIRQTEWQRMWMESAKLDYPPVVDVRRGYKKSTSGGRNSSDARASVLEACKYATKASSLLELGDALPEFAAQVHGLRYYACSRPLSAYLQTGDVTAEELLDNNLSVIPPHVPYWKCVADWQEDLNEYLFTSVEEQSPRCPDQSRPEAC